jgi:tRNA (cytidine/uridine-2'-O-)-methyltransferase|tara:strand:+ start:314 stop:763 length:450 start_codon:yes stop_codon:yes gene_type:complete
MISIALYKPDIPQNTAAIIRLSACFTMKVHIIEPCGFSLDDSRFKRVVMDYLGYSNIIRYDDFDQFKKKNIKSRIILMTTKSKKNYHEFMFEKNDILLFGRESAGVPKNIHNVLKNKLKIPINKKTRSLNVAMSAAIVSAEALKQKKLF